jgi:hypothetical protein
MEEIELGCLDGSEEWTRQSLHCVSEGNVCGTPETTITDSTIWSDISLDAIGKIEETCV